MYVYTYICNVRFFGQAHTHTRTHWRVEAFDRPLTPPPPPLPTRQWRHLTVGLGIFLTRETIRALLLGAAYGAHRRVGCNDLLQWGCINYWPTADGREGGRWGNWRRKTFRHRHKSPLLHDVPDWTSWIRPTTWPSFQNPHAFFCRQITILIRCKYFLSDLSTLKDPRERLYFRMS